MHSHLLALRWGLVAGIMYGIIDCNSFYASCEQAYDPALRGRPVVVLSNNDGCIIAVSKEIKAAKIAGAVTGAPYFKVRKELEAMGAVVRSSNYALYADKSRSIHKILLNVYPEVEIYSIDEVFVDLRSMRLFDLRALGQKARDLILAKEDVPVTVGMAPTKTLAKVANRIGKRTGVSVMEMPDEQTRREMLQNFPLEDVWGIGRRIAERMHKKGLATAWDFANLPDAWVQKTMGVVGLRMLLELRGTPCIPLAPPAEAKKQICTSRSFGKSLTEFRHVGEAIASHAHSCGEKLRSQHTGATELTVFLLTNRHRPEQPQYNPSRTIYMPVPTANTPELAGYALQALKDIWRDGCLYKKAGVIVSGITSAATVQMDLFDQRDRTKLTAASLAVDRLNRRYGRSAVVLGAQGTNAAWRPLAEGLSTYRSKVWQGMSEFRFMS